MWKRGELEAADFARFNEDMDLLVALESGVEAVHDWIEILAGNATAKLHRQHVIGGVDKSEHPSLLSGS
jgi:hypothetical protein